MCGSSLSGTGIIAINNSSSVVSIMGKIEVRMRARIQKPHFQVKTSFSVSGIFRQELEKKLRYSLGNLISDKTKTEFVRVTSWYDI